MKTDNLKQKQQCAIHGVVARFFPLFWFIYMLYKTDLVRGENGQYWCDPEILRISRIIFNYIPIQGKTKKGTKFCGNWHWFRLIYWEVHLLIYERKHKISTGRFP